LGVTHRVIADESRSRSCEADSGAPKRVGDRVARTNVPYEVCNSRGDAPALSVRIEQARRLRLVPEVEAAG
jgi:hypothetical protein